MSRFVSPFFDVGSGIKPASGAKLFFFESNTSTPKDTFSDEALSIANANPVISDSRGLFPDIFLEEGKYKVQLTDKNDEQAQPDADPVEGLTLSDIIKISSTSVVLDIPTLSAAITSTTLVNGQALNIQERTVGNGGGGLWDVVLASTVTPNTFEIVQCTGVATLALVLRLQGEIDVRQVGATGDGVTNDQPSIQRAVVLATGIKVDGRASDSKRVYAPSPKSFYRVDSTINIGIGVTLEGDGIGTDIQATGLFPVLTMTSGLDIYVRNLTLKNTVGGVGTSGVSIPEGTRIQFQNVGISLVDKCVTGDKTLYISFTECYFTYTGKGVEFTAAAGTWNVAWFNNVIKFDRCTFGGLFASTTGVDIVGMGVLMENCDTSHNAIGARIVGVTGSTVNKSHSCTIINNYAEDIDTVFQFKDVRNATIISSYNQGKATGSAATAVYDLDNADVFVVHNAMLDFFEHISVGINSSTIYWNTTFTSFTDTAFSSSDGTSLAHTIIDRETAKINPALVYEDIPLSASSTINTSIAKSSDNSPASTIFEMRQNNNITRHRWKVGGAANWNAADAAYFVARDTTTSRSINAAGTVNASGADYAEYMTKSSTCGDIQKGQVCGIDKDGKLTDKFDDAHSFVIKSTDPSYVGGDSWGTDIPFEEGTDEFKAEFDKRRAMVDRIAFSGQVPCFVSGEFKVGDTLIPASSPERGIECKAVSSPSLDQYLLSIGKVWAVKNGKAWVSVRVS
jgi:hypothetical protein